MEVGGILEEMFRNIAFVYSARNASIGSRLAARRAGSIPNTMPNNAEKKNAIPAEDHEMMVSQ